MTYKLRALPDFIIIGAQKCGTTSLYYYLTQHPQVVPAVKKEIHYFDNGTDPQINTFKNGPRWYRAHFPIRAGMRHRITGEASPLYLFHPLAPSRIYRLLPEVKLIAILRNPTERAISHYFHEKRKGRETTPLPDALKKEDRRLDCTLLKKEYNDFELFRHAYKRRGLYAEQLTRYIQIFGMNNLLVLNSESFFQDPKGMLNQVFEFLDIETHVEIRDLTPRNTATNKRKVDPDVYSYLKDYYRSHNQDLYRMINKRFDW